MHQSRRKAQSVEVESPFMYELYIALTSLVGDSCISDHMSSTRYILCMALAFS